ncbi:suppressor of fused domain protein [Janthinobacterium sp. GW460P]|uniref:suppressor of fused domain protein n=1 Tax=unclassified Janthinobacterium TaxID=2610881 RepID=UPI000A321952|nr:MULTISPECIES: suppressor of fused domain protein [unclassified Janthinobacterium]MCC7704698.1 suppressor of fused domain protein [Janthinobacterium sp. GW460P]MCC7710200.1 suppressor of fused domain protein [Janthinobacterium sp. GW460W]
MQAITDYQKEVAKLTAKFFSKEKPPILQFLDEEENTKIYVLKARDSPGPGLTSFATIGLSDHPLYLRGDEFETRTELICACDSNREDFACILATSSFFIVNSKFFCAPGIIFPGIIEMHNLSKTMSDVYFTNPFLWGDKFQSLHINNKNVAWLLAIPISKSETKFAAEFGSEKLEKLFSEEDTDIFDLNRASVV